MEELKTMIAAMGMLSLTSTRETALRDEVATGLRTIAKAPEGQAPKAVQVAGLLRTFEARLGSKSKLRRQVHGARLEAVDAAAQLGWCA